MKTTLPGSIEAFDGKVLRGRDEILAGLHDIGGKKVALIGDPREVARIVARIADRAGTLTVFQSDGQWVLPRGGGAVPLLGALLAPLPETIRRRVTADLGRRHLRLGVGDAWTRRQLTPRTAPSRDTIVYSDRYHRALRRPNVRLVSWPVAGIVAEGVRTADGLEHHVDVIAQVVV